MEFNQEIDDPIVKCVCCENEFNMQSTQIARDGSPICEDCFQDDISEPMATITIHHNKGDEIYQDIDMIFIGAYATDETDSEFSEDFYIENHYNNFRGYTDVKSNIWKEIGLVNTSQEHLAPMVNEFGDILLDNNIQYASCSARTSNCLVVNLSYWVSKKDYKKAMRIKNKLLKKYNLDKEDF